MNIIKLSFGLKNTIYFCDFDGSYFFNKADDEKIKEIIQSDFAESHLQEVVDFIHCSGKSRDLDSLMTLLALKTPFLKGNYYIEIDKEGFMNWILANKPDLLLK
jgi:hypothetical protein